MHDPPHILVAEDNPINRRLMTRILTTKGYEVTVAENGAVAVDLATNGEFDLVLMDIQMPVMDGKQAARQLRADSRTADLVLIAVTAAAMSHDRESIAEAGFDSIATKPVEIDDLLRIVEKWLRSGRGAGQIGG